MKLENYEMHLPSYSIGDKIYDKIGPVCESYGKTVLVIGGKRALEAAYEKIQKAVDQTNLVIIGKELYGDDCTYQNVERLRNMKLYQLADMVFGVGGGKALDTVKCLCIADDKPVFTFPTITSNCAACTSVSIIYNDDGTFLKPHFFIRPAMHAFIDTEIISKAPAQYMWAGIGDTYAKYYEATISSRGEQLEHFTSLGVALSLMCRNPLLEYGPKAYEDHKKKLSTYDHAGANETSIVMAFRPDLVDFSRVKEDESNLIGIAGRHPVKESSAEYGKRIKEYTIECIYAGLRSEYPQLFEE